MSGTTIEAEYQISVTDYTDTDTYIIEVEKVGGGTFSKKYAGTWRYAIHRNGEMNWHDGGDFVSGVDISHREAAIQIIGYFTDDVTEHDFQFPLAERFLNDD